MEVQNKSNVPVNGVRDLAKNRSIAQQILEVAQVLGEICLLIIKICYSLGESIYRTFAKREPKSVKGEIVLITGAGHGIGKELALQYASHGATVVGWDINQKLNQETIEEINKLGYPRAYSYVCDVANRDNVFEVAKKVQGEVGDVTVLINNAGIMPTHPLLEHTKTEIERIFNINVLAHYWTIQAFLPVMKKHNHGHIVALSSCAGLFGLENLVPYCGSKFAVRGYMEALDEELRLQNSFSKIQFTTICPYMVDTGLCKKPKIRFEALMPLLEPKFVAKSIVYAQRTNEKIVTIPNYMLTLNKIIRLLPAKGAMYTRDFLEAGVNSDL